MYSCPNCQATIGFLGTAYVCPKTRTAAPPHQPGPPRDMPRRRRDEQALDRGNRARKRRRTKKPPVEVAADDFGAIGAANPH